MASVFLGSGLGLFESSLTQLNGYGSSGSARIGRGQDEALVNAGTGNLILRSQDEYLASIGLDSSMVRTYNSQGQADGDNNDGWRISAYRSLAIGSGTNPITRTGGDGHATTFTWDAGQSAWISSEGDGANDRIQLVSSQYQYLEGGTGVVEIYDATGKLLSLQDGNGNTLTYGYTGALITSITDQKGQKVLLTYTGNNLSDIRVLGLIPGTTSTTQKQTLIRVQYNYDGLNRLASAIVELTANNASTTFDTNIYTTTYAYDGTSTRVSKVTQNYGSAAAISELAIQYVHVNGQYRVWTLTDGQGRTTEFSYDTTARKTLVTDPLGNVTTYTYDTSGRLTRVDLPKLNGSANNIQYVYDSSSNITQVTDAAGRVVKYTYDGRSNLTQILDSIGNTVTRTYGADDRLLSETTYTTPAPAAFAAGSPAGPLTTNYVYDALGKGNLRYLITAEGRVTEYKYDAQGEKTSAIRYLGGTYAVASGLGESNLNAWVSGQDKTKTQRTDSAYDLSGQIKSVTRWNATDSSGNGVSDGFQSIQRFVYDVSGRLLISSDPRTSSTTAGAAYVTSYTYDGLNRVLSTTDGTNRTTTTVYDDALNKINVTAPGGRLTSSVFNKSGDLISVSQAGPTPTNQDYGTTNYAYDANGRLVMQTDPTGGRTFYAYDERGRRVGVVSPEGELTETVYNADDQVIKTIVYVGLVTTSTLVDGSGKPLTFDLISLRGGTRTNALPRIDLDSADGYVAGTGHRAIYTTALSTIAVVPTGGTRLTVSDSNTATLASASIKLVDRPDTTSELLSVTLGSSGLTATYMPTTGVLSLTGVASLAIYQQVLATLSYQNLAATPAQGDRRIEVSLNDGTSAGNVATTVVTVATSGGTLTAWTGTAEGIPAMATVTTAAASNSTNRIRYFAYDSAGRLVYEIASRSSSLNYVTGYTYDGAGRVLSRTQYLASGTLTSFSGLVSNVTVTADANGGDRTERYFYDADGRRVATLDADGYLTETIYNNAGQSSRQIVYATQTNAAYWASGTLADLRPAVVATKDLVSWTIYDGQGRVSWTVDTQGFLTELGYNVAGNLISQKRYYTPVSYDGSQTLNTLRTVASVSGKDQLSSKQYDALNRLTQETDVQGSITKYVYDTRGFLISKTTAFGQNDALGRADARTATYLYDDLGRVTASLSGIGSSVYASHAGNAAQQQTDINTYGVRNTYDLAGRLRKTVDPDGSATWYYYDRDSRLRYTVRQAYTDTATSTTYGEVSETQYNSFGNVAKTIQYATRIDVASLAGGLLTESGNAAFVSTVSASPFTTHASNRSVTNTYADNRGLLTQVLDAGGFSTTYSYDAFGQLTSQVVNVGATPGASTRTDTFSYNERGHRIGTIQDGVGLNLITAAVYDAFGRVTQTQDANGNLTNTSYDNFGRTVVTTDPLLQGSTTVYDAFARVLSRTDRLGNTTTYAYNDAAQSLTTTTPEGIQITTVSNRHGQTIKVTDGVGTITTYLYDKNGNLNTTKVDPTVTAGDGRLNLVTTNYYDVSDLLTSTVDARGIITTYTYDAANRVLKRTVDFGTGTNTITKSPYLNLVTQYEYDAFGGAIRVTDPNGITTETIFDKKAQTSAVIVDTAGLKLATVYTYDAQGRTLTVREGVQAIGSPGTAHNPGTWNYSGTALKTTEYQYNKAGWRTFEILDPGAGRLNVTTRYDYDKNGNLTRKKSPRTDQTIYTWYTYDANNRLAYTVDALGGVTKNDYDAEGRITTVTQYANSIDVSNFGTVVATSSVNIIVNTGNDRSISTFYDKDGRALYVANNLGEVSEKRYDAAGRVIESTRYERRLPLVSKVNLSRLSGETAYMAPDQSLLPGNAIYSKGGQFYLKYQTDGNLVLYKFGGGAVWASNTAGTTPGKAAYQADGNFVIYNQSNTIVWSSGTQAYPGGYLSVEENGTLAIYSADGTAVWSAGTEDLTAGKSYQKTNYAYDAAGRLTSTVDAEGYTESYQYDAAGNRTKLINKKSDSWNYSYDALGRITQEVGPAVEIGISNTSSSSASVSKTSGFKTTRFTYDALGNVLTRTEGYSTNSQGTAFVSNRVSTYTYDTRGLQVRSLNAAVGVYDATVDADSSHNYIGRNENSVSLETLTVYDERGQAIASRDVGGNFSYKVYDFAGRVVYEIDAERYLTAYGYDANGNITSQTRYAKRVIDDSATSSDTNRSALLDYESAAYVPNPQDAVARNQAQQAQALLKSRADALVANANASKRTIKTQFDKLDRKQKVTQPTVAYYIADAATPRADASPVTEYQYDAFDGIVVQRTARQAITSGSDTAVSEWITTYYGYDTAGRQTHQVDALGYYTRIDYDGYGRVRQRTEYAKPLSSIPTSQPDFATLAPPPDTAPSANDPAGYDRVVQYLYDRMDRVTQELAVNAKYSIHSGATVVDQIGTIINKATAYDALGNAVAVTDASGATTLTYYDKLGRAIGVREPAQTSTADGSRASFRSIYSTYALTGSSVRVEWDSLDLWGGGDVRVTVAYQVDYTTYQYEYEEGIRYVVGRNTTRRNYSSITTSTAQKGLTGTTVTLGTGANLAIQSVLVEKLVGSNWVVVHNIPASGYQPRVEVGNLPPSVSTVELRYGTPGSGTYPNTLTLSRMGNSNFWAGSFANLPQGDYAYEVTATDSLGAAVDLTTVGGTSAGKLTGIFSVIVPEGDVAWLRADGAVQSVTPLVTYVYDALGNQLVETRHAAPNVTMPTSGTPATSDTNDQRTYYRYDVLGRVKETIDAENKFEYRSYDAYGNVAKVWRNVTDVINGSSDRRQATEVYSYDRNGQQIETLYVRRNPLNSTFINDRYRSAFNAYGEQIARGINVSDINNVNTYQEFYDYDALGRLWQSNQSGLTKAYEFDLQGNTTSEVILAGSASTAANTLPTMLRLSSASLVKSQWGTGTIRSSMIYDVLGRLTEKREQAFTQSSAVPFDGTASTDLATATIKQLNTATLNGFNPGVQGRLQEGGGGTGDPISYMYYTDYSVNVSWSSISSLSPTSIRAVMGISFVGGTTGSYTSDELSASTYTAGGTISWRDYNTFNSSSSPPKIQSITSIAIYAKIAGKWMFVRDMGQTSAGIGINIPSQQTVSISGNAFYYRIDGSNDSFNAASAGSPTAGAFRIANPTTTAGTYEYYFDVIGSQDDHAGLTTRYRGTFTVSGGVITAFGRPAAESVAPVRVQTLDRWGNVLTTVDPRNAAWVTNYRYDHAGRLVEQLAPTVVNWLETGGSTNVRPQTINYYDVRGQLIGVRDPNGNLRRRIYDEVGQLVQEIHADNGVVTSAYDTLGRLVRSRDTMGTVTQRNYDKLDRVIRQEVLGFAAGEERYNVYTYDEQGNRTSDTNALNESRRYRYDTRGNLVADLSPLWINGNASKGHLSILSEYDAYGRKIREENGVKTDGSTFDYQSWDYDHFGRQIAYRDLAGSTGRIYYDGFGRAIRQTQIAVTQTATNPNVTTHSSDLRYLYAANGSLLQLQEWSGGSQQRVTEYRYDSAGNRISERYSEGDNILHSETRVQYDALGRVIQTEDDGYVQNTGYDAVGNRRRLTTRYNSYSSSDSWYLYDFENRIVRAKATRVGGVVQNNGTEVAYDNAGNRMYERTGTGNYSLYYYNVANQLTETKISPNTTGGNPSSQRFYDRAGRVITYLDYGTAGGALQATRKLYYNVNGWLIAQNSYKSTGAADSSVRYSSTITGDQGALSSALASNHYAGSLGNYNAVGKASSYVVFVENGSNDYTNTYSYQYLRFGGDYREYSQTAATTAPNYKSGTSTSTYDAYGNVVAVADPNGQTANRTYISTADGRYIKQTQNPGASPRVQRYYYANGQQVGSSGSIDPVSFDLNYTPISEAYPPNAPGLHIVRQGETLRSIALAYFGDASLYYLIADANGLSTGATPIAGQSLTIPNRVTNINNNSSTFKPYNPGEIIGDTTPTMKYVPPPPPKKKCGGILAMIVIAVVVVVATIYTAGVASTFLAGSGTFGAGAFTAGTAALGGAAAAGGGIAASIGVTATSVAAAAVGGAVGSIAGQLTGMAMGVQDGFSWGQVAVSAVGAGIGAGIGSLGQQGGLLTKITNATMRGAVQGAITSAANQGINIALGQQKKFSWSSLAASTVTSAVASGQGHKNPLNKYIGDGVQTMQFSSIAADAATRTAYGVLNRAITIALDGKGKIDFASIAADSFGNALGNSIVGQIEFSAEVDKLGNAGKEQYDWARANGKSADEALAQGRYRDAQDMQSFFAGGSSSSSVFTGESYEVAGGGSGLGLRDGSGITTYAMGERPELGAPTPIAPVPLTGAQRADYERHFGLWYEPLDRRAAERQLASEMYALPGTIRDGLQQNLVEFGSRSGPIGSTVAGLTYSGLSVAIPFDTYGGAAAGVVGGEVLGSIARIPAVSRVLNTDLGALAGNVRRAGTNFLTDFLGISTPGSVGRAAAGETYREIVGSVPGRILSEADALTPGALGDDFRGLPGTFSGGRYATMQLEESLTVYRAWAPGQSREFGAFWSLDQPLGSLQTRIDSALLPQWGNVRGTPFSLQATEYTAMKLPAGTTIHIGEVGSQGGAWVGGRSQMLIDGGPQEIWKIGGGKLQ